jgi:hypothetical protein
MQIPAREEAGGTHCFGPGNPASAVSAFADARLATGMLFKTTFDLAALPRRANEVGPADRKCVSQYLASAVARTASQVPSRRM